MFAISKIEKRILDSFHNVLQNKRKLQFLRTRNNEKVSDIFSCCLGKHSLFRKHANLACKYHPADQYAVDLVK